MKQTPLKRKSELKRTSALSGSGSPLKRGGPLKQKRRRMSVAESRAADVFKQAYVGDTCYGCRLVPAQVSHHVVLEQYLKPALKWRLENQLSLCHTCHSNHHSANGPKVARIRLREDNLDFASEVLGGAAGSYLARRYS